MLWTSASRKACRATSRRGQLHTTSRGAPCTGKGTWDGTPNAANRLSDDALASLPGGQPLACPPPAGRSPPARPLANLTDGGQGLGSGGCRLPHDNHHQRLMAQVVPECVLRVAYRARARLRVRAALSVDRCARAPQLGRARARAMLATAPAERRGALARPPLVCVRLWRQTATVGARRSAVGKRRLGALFGRNTSALRAVLHSNDTPQRSPCVCRNLLNRRAQHTSTIFVSAPSRNHKGKGIARGSVLWAW